MFRKSLGYSAAFALLLFASAGPALALQCSLKDPTGSVECVNPGTSWCGNTCQAEPSCPNVGGSQKSVLDCGSCACQCPGGTTTCDGKPFDCQIQPDKAVPPTGPSCPSLFRVSDCSNAGNILTCGACLSGYVECSGTCTAATSPSCLSPKIYNPCTGVCTDPYILVSPTPTQTAGIDISGDIKQGGDLYIPSGKAIKVPDQATPAYLNIGNWGIGGFKLDVFGDTETRGTLTVGLNNTPTVGASGNLLYGVMQSTSAGNFLKFETVNGGLYTTKFLVDNTGKITTGSIGWSGVTSAPTASCAANQFVSSFNGTTYACSSPIGAAPSGAAGGDLAGNYPNPTVAADAVALGTDTTGNYVAGITPGTGISVGGSAAEGWSPTIAVNQATLSHASIGGTLPLTKLAAGTGSAQIIVTDVSNNPVYVNMTGDATLSPAGVLTLNAASPSFVTSITTPLVKSPGGILTLDAAASAGADDLVFKTAGTEQMRIYESGGVGFGGPALTLPNVGSNLIYGNISASSAAGSSLLKLQTGSVDKFVVDKDGKLTVGDVPWARLSGFPTACPANQFVSAIGGSLTCNAPTGLAGGALNDTLRWNGTAWVASSALQNNGTNVTATGTVNVTAGDLNVTNGYVNTNGFSMPTGAWPGMVLTALDFTGEAYWDYPPSGVSGSGTVNRLAKFTSVTGIGDSTISDDGSTVTFTGNLSLPTTTSTAGQILTGTTRIFHAYGTGNVFAGSWAGNFTTTASYNAAFGSNALRSMTSGGSNVAVGYSSLYSNTTGSSNTALGTSALTADTTGFSNTAVGAQALPANIIGNSNTAVGGIALQNTVGDSNTALGYAAGAANTVGTSNLYLGYLASAYANNYVNSAAIGANAMVGCSNCISLGANANVGVGDSTPPSLFSVGTNHRFQVDSNGNLIKINNVTYSWPLTVAASAGQVLASDTSGNLTWATDAIGVGGSGTIGKIPKFTAAGALGDSVITESGGNIGIGSATPGKALDVVGDLRVSSALFLPTVTNAALVNYGSNPFIGTYGGGSSVYLGNLAGNKDITGDYSTGIGSRALYKLTSGSYNTAVGNNSLYYLTIGENNTGVGWDSFMDSVSTSGNTGLGSRSGAKTTGSGNVMVGYLAGYGVYAVSTYRNSVGVGYNALAALTTGDDSTAVGANALNSLTAGKGNVAVGSWAGSQGGGSAVTTGDYNTLIGTNSATYTGTVMRATALGYGSRVNQNDAVVLGDPNNAATAVGIRTQTPGKTLDVIGDIRASGQYCIGASCISAWPISGVGGSGTIGKIPKFVTNSTTLGDSLISESGTTVSVGGALSVTTSSGMSIYGESTSSGFGLFGKSNSGNGVYATCTSFGCTAGQFINTAGGTGLYISHGGGGKGLHVSTSNGYAAVFEGGSVGIGSSAPGKTLDVTGDIRASGQYCIGASCISAWPTSGVGGSGTLNKLAKFTPDGTHVGDSLIIDDGTDLAIATAVVSGQKLTIDGTSGTIGLKVVVGQNGNQTYRWGGLFTVDNNAATPPSGPAPASSNFGVKGTSTGNVFMNYGGNFVANGAGYNYGAYGKGEGQVGVTQNNYGGQFAGRFGSKAYGVEAIADGASGTNYGLKSQAVTNVGQTGYGIYAEVNGTGTKYSGVFMGGNVGIGTVSPAELLQVAGSDSSQVPLLVTNAGPPTSLGNPYAWIGGSEWVASSYQTIGFGYRTTVTDEPAAEIGLLTTDTTDHQFGDLIFALRNTTGAADKATEKVRITSAGRVGIGTNAPGYALTLSTDSAAKPSTSTWTVSSDRRLKENITPFTDGLAVVRRINPVNYVYNGLGGNPKGLKGIGVIAQDVMDVVPYSVTLHPAKLHPDDIQSTELYDFNSSALIFINLNAVKELDAVSLKISADGLVSVPGDLTAENNKWGTGSGWKSCPADGSECSCPDGSFITKIRKQGTEIYCNKL